ncbi:UNVERIFIED_ORG: diguanylate cyclase (GGDEF)-like protein [Nocardia globerula]|uniref:Diguanylate cyclase (GGDEF)-like protein n=1 Tax=Nocardia globerula TaxID=1818 RepID=A0A652YT33_NOCGL|nr:putative diguanylate cyclase YcdT [Rhodococcus sp. AD45]PVX67266.1 diguanylate cyclase (GGDEF)-like protein [Rhodococcus globerulus]
MQAYPVRVGAAVDDGHSGSKATERPFSSAALHRVAPLLVDWYRRPDQFESFTRYLADKGLTGASRTLVVSSLLLVIVVMFLTRFSPAGPTTHGERTANLVIIVLTALMAAILATRGRLERSWSYVFVIYSEIGIAAALVLYSNPLAALAHSVMFSVIGGYIAFFHNARMQTLHLLWASVVVIGVVARIAYIEKYTDVPSLIAMVLLVGAAIYAIPFACQFVFSILGTDALKAQHDPLSGLLNRRGLADEVGLMLHRPFESSTNLVVAAVDINRFKTINDEYGHDVGDVVIEKVAARLTQSAGPSALIARIGGDEFVLVDRCDDQEIDSLAESLRNITVTGPEHPVVELSVGIVAAAGPFGSPDRAIAVYGTLLRSADQAMYTAKARQEHAVVVLRNLQ